MTALSNFLRALAAQDATAWSILTGALVCTAVGLFALYLLVAFFVYRSGDLKWRRLLRAHGGDEASAMATVLLLEADFEQRCRRGWDRAMTTSGDH